jgi:hypothetical protein
VAGNPGIGLTAKTHAALKMKMGRKHKACSPLK